MSTRRRWILTVAVLLGPFSMPAAQEQRQPATVTLVIEGMT